MDLTAHWVGFAAIVIFVLAYSLVIVEEFTHLRKSVPVMLAAGVIWAIIALQYAVGGMHDEAHEAVKHFLIEFAELFLFLLCAMTYVNSMSERRVFDALRSWLVRKGFSYRRLFWITGVISFFLSPIIDNLTTALVMCAVVLAVGRGNRRFIGIGCVNIVVAANAGGAFSPFGDITTLMVWQRGILDFFTFFNLFVPSVVNYVIPAVIMAFFVEKAQPEVTEGEGEVRHEARRQADHVPVRLHDRDRGVVPQLPAPAAVPGHDDRPRVPQDLRPLPQPLRDGDPAGARAARRAM